MAATAPRSAWPDPRAYPQLRFMGSKHRLLPWLEGVLGELEFDSALDAFSGSGCVAYLLKTMGKEVRANDFLQFTCDLTRATVANSHATLGEDDLAAVREPAPGGARFIEETFRGIFFADEDNRFLDRVVHHAAALDPARRALVLASLHRACLKRQPRGVFTVSGLGRYDDGRRDLRLSLEEHFLESAALFNGLVFDNGREHRVTCGDVFALDGPDLDADLVYLDPPYVPRADDNCYIKRYHFLEGLSTYWQDAEFHPTSRVRKLAKRHTPFSYRREAERRIPPPLRALRGEHDRPLVLLERLPGPGRPDAAAAGAQGGGDRARAGAPLPLRHPPRRGAAAGSRVRVPDRRRLSCAARQEPVPSLRSPLRRGHQPGTAARYASYSAPKVRARVGSS